MSYLHYAHAKEIKRVLALSVTGMTRAQLFDALELKQKAERPFGEALAELCHGKHEEVVMIRDVGTFTLYKLRANYVEPAPRIPVPRRVGGGVPLKSEPTYRFKRASGSLVPQRIRHCACGVELKYSGRGRWPVACETCKAKRVRPRREKRCCPTCGQRIKAAA